MTAMKHGLIINGQSFKKFNSVEYEIDGRFEEINILK
jgi:hypothetical protein